MHTNSSVALAIAKSLAILKVVDDCPVAKSFLEIVDTLEHLAYMYGTHFVI
jgi:hypothetical protein